MIRLLVVDDHPPSREKAIADLSAGDLIEIIAEAETSDEAYKQAKTLLPDVVLLDLHLPGLMTTPDLLKKLVGLKNVRVVIFASQSKASEVQDFLDMGAAAYVLKDDPPALLRMSILMVYRGSQGIVSPSLPPNLLRLSSQERNILREIGRRGGIPKAAERMGLTEYDLDQILYHIAAKLEIESNEKLAKWAKKHGF
ncbi:MAG: response regulator [Candidatus Obscuribacterales bacterium]|nr:response regulator [Candidatus Obscuribacterales bacterium]